MGNNNEDKLRALDAALGQIEKQYGKGAVMKLGDSAANMNVETIPTGSLSLDIALGLGGVPKGRIIEVYGPESSGKTTVALHMVAEVQKRGGIAGFIDAEHALDPAYAKNIGVDIENLYISQPDNGEQALEIILCPILKEVKKLYLQYGFSIDLLNILFKGMKFTKRLNGEEMRYSTSLTIKNQYLCYGLMLNNRLNMFPYSDNNDKQEKQIFEKMEKYMVNKNHKRNARSLSATFDEVLEVLKPEELLKHLEWFQNQIEFAIQIVEKYDDRKISRKKKVSTILEEL